MLRFWGSQEQQSQPRPQDGSSSSSSSQSWYPPSVVGSPSSSRPATPTGSSSGTFTSHRPTERLLSPSHVPPAEAARFIAVLKDKRHLAIAMRIATNSSMIFFKACN